LITVDNAGTEGVANVVLAYQYDDNGNIVSVNDSIEGVAGGNTGYVTDELDRVKTITQSGNNVADKRVDFDYDAIGQYESISRYSDLDGTDLVVESSYEYDDANRLTNLTHGNVAEYDFEYDAANRITSIRDVDGTSNYSYDDIDQLTSSDRTSLPDESYTYDKNGNRTNAGYVTGKNNQLLSDGTYNYEYDSEGNLTRQTAIATGKVQEFTWDYLNRLVAVVDKDNQGVAIQRVEFTYDMFGRRLSMMVDNNPLDGVEGSITYFVYDRDNVILDFVDDGSGVVLDKRYLHGNRVDQVLALDDGSGGVQWHLADHLGSVRDLVDNSGIGVNHFTYDSFGSLISETNPAFNTRYLFTGREWDKEIGLRFHRGRYANANGFISEDPIGFNGGDTNLYRYVGNNPINFIDPTGMLSAELTALVSQSHPGPNKGSKPSTIWFYNTISPTYTTALSTATSWFYIITERASRKQTKNDPGADVPWVATGFQLKNNPGKVSLRPWGGSPASLAKPEPKLEFQQDENGQWPWQKPLQIKEIIFEVKDDRDRNNPPCPNLFPAQEPQFTPPASEAEEEQPSFPDIEIPNPFQWIWPIIRWIGGGERRV
jgi:RHS repeat-associated protein